MQKAPKHLVIKKDIDLLQELRVEVNNMVKQLPSSRLNILKFKLFLFPALYFLFYILALRFPGNVFFYHLMFCFMGLMVVIIFINLIHELCHGNVFKNQRYNNWGYLLFDILGANSYIWKQRHLTLHHRYPNTQAWDSDLEQKGPVLIFPGEQHKKYHRYQHIYMLMLYPLFILNWLLVRDFKDYFGSKSIVKKVLDIPRTEYVKLFLFKAFYVGMIVFIPWLVTNVSFWQGLGGLLALTFSASLFALIILLPPHANTENDFFEVDDSMQVPNSWFKHQILATNDLNNTNWFIRNLMGNFNYHLAHHLFPQVSHVFAPEVTQVVKNFLRRHGLPYRSLNITAALRKHYELVKRNAITFGELDL